MIWAGRRRRIVKKANAGGGGGERGILRGVVQACGDLEDSQRSQLNEGQRECNPDDRSGQTIGAIIAL